MPRTAKQTAELAARAVMAAKAQEARHRPRGMRGSGVPFALNRDGGVAIDPVTLNRIPARRAMRMEGGRQVFDRRTVAELVRRGGTNPLTRQPFDAATVARFASGRPAIPEAAEYVYDMFESLLNRLEAGIIPIRREALRLNRPRANAPDFRAKHRAFLARWLADTNRVVKQALESWLRRAFPDGPRVRADARLEYSFLGVDVANTEVGFWPDGDGYALSLRVGPPGRPLHEAQRIVRRRVPMFDLADEVREQAEASPA